MNRKEFLKAACGLAACGCARAARPALAATEAEAKPAVPPEPPDQRLAFARYQVAKLAGFLAEAPAAAGCAELVRRTGRECARLGQLGATFRGRPEAYFAEAQKAYGTEFRWDKEKGTISVAVPGGPCGCPLVDARRTPAFWCQCSVGYQQETFEALFGKPVEVALRESKLGGSKRCVFEVKVT
jgi:predicted hydrocarbon binding protein